MQLLSLPLEVLEQVDDLVGHGSMLWAVCRHLQSGVGIRHLVIEQGENSKTEADAKLNGFENSLKLLPRTLVSLDIAFRCTPNTCPLVEQKFPNLHELHLQMRAPCVDGPCSPPLMAKLCSVLRCCPALRSLTLNCKLTAVEEADDDLPDKLLALLESEVQQGLIQLTQLKKLEMRIDYFADDAFGLSPAHLCKIAPNLEHFVFDCGSSCDMYHQVCVQVPANGLPKSMKTLDIDLQGWTHLLEIGGTFPNIAELRLALTYNEQDNNDLVDIGEELLTLGKAFPGLTCLYFGVTGEIPSEEVEKLVHEHCSHVSDVEVGTFPVAERYF
eukprot:TRINITY_DN32128_c0_g1_i1.p1 TRINITY_DN32128_c0_g1~~TRINITY_DN32128_c0_g1_i1.p1  ORF type:complete len:328 (-),score=36.69 TRINITY_DN32128_c0_g1_i1:44-1027(-)